MIILPFFWFFFAFVIAFAIGAVRKIGFWASFLFSILLSPFIGLIITLSSETKEKAAAREKMLSLQQENNRQQRAATSVSVADELMKLNKIFTEGIITKEEFEQQKKKLLR